MANNYSFQYLPLEGKLSGKSFEQQTEDVINDLGNRIVNAETDVSTSTELVQTAYDTATEAQNTADAALSAANNAQTTATNAEATAQSALTAATDAASTKADIYHASDTTDYGIGSGTLYGHVMLSDAAGESDASGGAAVTPLALKEVVDSLTELSAEVAEDSAAMSAAIEEAQAAAAGAATAADAAQETADAAQEAADAAQTSAGAAQSTADTALTQAVTNTDSINSLRESVSMIMNYEPVGEVDLNDYDEYARLYITAGSTNAPSDDEAFFVDVDVASDSGIIRQTAVSLADSFVYVRWAAITATETTDETDETETGTDDESTNDVTYTTAWSEWTAIQRTVATDEETDEMLESIFG